MIINASKAMDIQLPSQSVHYQNRMRRHHLGNVVNVISWAGLILVLALFVFSFFNVRQLFFGWYATRLQITSEAGLVINMGGGGIRLAAVDRGYLQKDGSRPDGLDLFTSELELQHWVFIDEDYRRYPILEPSRRWRNTSQVMGLGAGFANATFDVQIPQNYKIVFRGFQISFPILYLIIPPASYLAWRYYHAGEKKEKN